MYDPLRILINGRNVKCQMLALAIRYTSDFIEKDVWHCFKQTVYTFFGD